MDASRVAELNQVMGTWDETKLKVFIHLTAIARRDDYIGDQARIAMQEMGISFDEWKEWNKQKRVDETIL